MPEKNDDLSVENPLLPAPEDACGLDAQPATLQSIINHAPADIYMKDLSGRYLLVNRNFGLRVGMDPRQILGKTVRDLFPENEANLFEANDKRVVDNKKGEQFEEKMLTENGAITFVSEKFPLRNDEGEIYAVCGISSDISNRKEFEEKLRKLNNQIQQQGRTLETVLSSSPNIVYMFDSQGRFLYANKLGATNLGVRSVDIIGRTWNSLNLPAGVFEPFMVHVSVVFKTGQTVQGALSFPTPDGALDYAYTLIPNMDVRGRVVNVIAYVNDVTAEREKDRVLKKQTQELYRSNRELEQFAKIASHDLNEPLRMVQSYLQLLEEKLGDSLADDHRKYLNHALDGAGRMRMLIGDLLEYSRVGVGRGPIIEVSMQELLEQVLLDLKVRIDELNATVTFGKLPNVWGNTNLLRQLLQNLVSNGLKYNRNEAPTIHVSFEQNNDSWVFEVKDNGIGIEKRDFDRIFQIFQRLHGRAEFSGTGIGLAICRKIMLQHDGDLWVKSEEGDGSSFFFSLPIRYQGASQMMINLFEDQGR